METGDSAQNGLYVYDRQPFNQSSSVWFVPMKNEAGWLKCRHKANSVGLKSAILNEKHI